MLQLLTMVAHLGNYAVLVPSPAGYYATHILYGIAKMVGWLAGYQPWYEEYASSRLHRVADAGAGEPKLDQSPHLLVILDMQRFFMAIQKVPRECFSLSTLITHSLSPNTSVYSGGYRDSQANVGTIQQN